MNINLVLKTSIKSLASEGENMAWGMEGTIIVFHEKNYHQLVLTLSVLSYNRVRIVFNLFYSPSTSLILPVTGNDMFLNITI